MQLLRNDTGAGPQTSTCMHTKHMNIYTHTAFVVPENVIPLPHLSLDHLTGTSS